MTRPVWGCARHAQLGTTCCQHTEILVTDGDRARIAAHVGADDFVEVRQPEDPSYALDPTDAGWAEGFLPDGSRPVLKHQPNGDCTFLGASGCSLPLAVRPLICRLFPFEYDESGITGVSSRCPAEVVPPGGTLSTTLGLDRALAASWRDQLYAELAAAPRRPREDR